MPKKNDQKEYESKEELWISYYLDELKKNKFILEWEYQKHTYLLSDTFNYQWLKKLKTKGKYMNSALLQKHEYTPDFTILWQSSAHHLFYNTIEDGINLKSANFVAHGIEDHKTSIIDVKPAFDMQNMTRLFSINQKWMMQKLGLYIQKIIPVKESKHYHMIGNKKKKVYSHSTWTGLFPKTFTPQRYFLTDLSMKKRKINYDAKTLEQYISS